MCETETDRSPAVRALGTENVHAAGTCHVMRAGREGEINAGRPNHEDTVLAPRLALIYRTVRGHGTGERRPRRKGGRVPAEITYHTKLLTPATGRKCITDRSSFCVNLFRLGRSSSFPLRCCCMLARQLVPSRHKAMRVPRERQSHRSLIHVPN